MRVALTGATGAVGHWIAAHLLAEGHAVTALGRRPPALPDAAHLAWDLAGPAPDLRRFDVLIHAALSHAPGRYRGGEGADPAGFRALNLDGTLGLFDAARAAGVPRILFLSSRAVLDGHPPDMPLADGLPPRPTTLYGAVKAAAEAALSDLAGPHLAVASLRATGVYGPPVPGLRHKWQDLLDAFDRGEAVAPRAGTEVHALDLAAAVLILAAAPPAALAPAVFNLADIALDRRDLLAEWARLTGRPGPLPARAPAPPAFPADRLGALGWRPQGRAGVTGALQALARAKKHLEL